jgi:hypothetical protein
MWLEGTSSGDHLLVERLLCVLLTVRRTAEPDPKITRGTYWRMPEVSVASVEKPSQAYGGDSGDNHGLASGS